MIFYMWKKYGVITPPVPEFIISAALIDDLKANALDETLKSDLDIMPQVMKRTLGWVNITM